MIAPQPTFLCTEHLSPLRREGYSEELNNMAYYTHEREVCQPSL